MISAYPHWYKIPAVKFQIIKYCFKREIALISPNYLPESNSYAVRMLRIHNVSHLDVWLHGMNIWNGKKLYNFYSSSAQYEDGIPYGSLALNKRNFGDWKENHWKQIIAYDFVLDVDAENHNDIDFIYSNAQNIKEFFDSMNCPYHVIFSGKGFHFRIPYEFFKEFNLSFDYASDNSIFKLYRNIAVSLNNKFCEYIDTSIYDSRRLIKIPFSLALYNNKTYLCRPFSSENDFEDFTLRGMLPERNLRNIREMKDYLFNRNGKVIILVKKLGL